MQQCLTNPEAGYYTTRDPFGRRGDFVTSPEISQMFGELVAVWIANEYVGSSAASPMTLIELGPGRGTLMQDVLRVSVLFQLCSNTSADFGTFESDSELCFSCLSCREQSGAA